jgi:peptidoglycan hydrolase-like protein with peptidoglycan-binding domain
MYGQAVAGASSSAWNEVLAGNRLLRPGSSGEAVEALQQLLMEQGQRLLIDGDFGPGTTRAVRAVQARFGLSVDGVVGGDTARALEGQSPSPTRGDQSDDRQQDASDTSAATTIEEVRVNAGSFVRQGLREQVFSKALTAFKRAWRNGDTERLVFTVIDYEMSSRDKRMWVIDLATGRLLFHERVTHGKGSDRNHDSRAERMSNEDGSNASNVGLLRTAETYRGRHGESLRLDGLEGGFNENARSRAIVMHSADYADDDFFDRHGKLGRSQGCPALDPDVAGEVIETVKGGSLIFGYYPDPAWLRRSRYLN